MSFVFPTKEHRKVLIIFAFFDMKRYSSKSLFYIILIFALVVFVYYPSLRYEFVWDDLQLYLTSDNFPASGLIEKIPEYFIPTKNKMYIPVTLSVWNIICNLGGKEGDKFNPLPFHLANVLVHFLNAILVFFILKRMRFEERFSFLGALFFALHPIQVESVAWVSELRGLLSALFGFLAIFFYLSGSNNKISKRLLIILFLVLSILSKPSGIVFPIIIIVLDFFVNQKLSWKNLIYRNLVYILLIIPFAMLAKFGEATQTIDFAPPIWIRPILWLNSIGFYIFKITIPIDFSPGYGLTHTFLIQNPTHFLYISISFIIIIFGLIWKNKYFWLGLLIFVAGFLPVSNLLSFYYQYYSTVSDRYVYISMLGLSLFVPFLVKKIAEKYFVYLIASLVILFVYFAKSELPKWQNEFELWNDCIEKYPNRIPHPYLGRGLIFQSNKNFFHAEQDYNKAIELDSNYYFAYYNRGNLFLDLNNYDKAIEDFTRAIQINRLYVNSYVNRALAFMSKGDYRKAIDDFSFALQLDSNQFDVYYNRALCYLELGDLERALSDLNETLKINPRYFPARKVREEIFLKKN